MNFEVISIPSFDRKAKRLAKKFPSLKHELQELKTNLANDPKQGDTLGNGCYKVRLGIESKGKGKSGGARVITNVFVAHNTVYMLNIYDKSEQEDVSDKDLLAIIKSIR
jgi:mRNA-degrading endonuclease RelE of RelBE toxin-antitoxin system